MNNSNLKILIVTVLLFYIPLYGFAEPWEATDIVNVSQAFNNKIIIRNNLFDDLINASINIYQEKQSDKSIHRCAFYTSCSLFLTKAIKLHGFPVGILMFFDRYFFRENKQSFSLYSLKKRSDGVYKLDDEYFLY